MKAKCLFGSWIRRCTNIFFYLFKYANGNFGRAKATGRYEHRCQIAGLFNWLCGKNHPTTTHQRPQTYFLTHYIMYASVYKSHRMYNFKWSCKINEPIRAHAHTRYVIQATRFNYK